MPVPRCLACDNSGLVIQWRLVWKRKSGDDGLQAAPPVKCSRRVASQEDGLERLDELGAEDFDAEVVSCAAKCKCRAKSPPATEVAGTKEAPADREPEESDWKIRQQPAGDR